MERKGRAKSGPKVEFTKWTRKPALGNSPVDCCNRRGFSAEKRVHFGPPLHELGIRDEELGIKAKDLSRFQELRANNS